MVLLRLADGSKETPPGPLALFLATLLAALKTCFASFSSVNIAWIAVMDDFARESELDQRLAHSSIAPNLEKLATLTL